MWIRDAVTDSQGNKYFALSYVNDTVNFVKFDNQWNLVWKKSLDNRFFIQKMIFASDGNILAVGIDKNYKTYLCSLNTDAVMLWKSENSEYSPFGSLSFSSILEMPDNKIVVTYRWLNKIDQPPHLMFFVGRTKTFSGRWPLSSIISSSYRSVWYQTSKHLSPT